MIAFRAPTSSILLVELYQYGLGANNTSQNQNRTDAGQTLNDIKRVFDRWAQQSVVSLGCVLLLYTEEAKYTFTTGIDDKMRHVLTMIRQQIDPRNETVMKVVGGSSRIQFYAELFAAEVVLLVGRNPAVEREDDEDVEDVDNDDASEDREPVVFAVGGSFDF